MTIHVSTSHRQDWKTLAKSSPPLIIIKQMQDRVTDSQSSDHALQTFYHSDLNPVAQWYQYSTRIIPGSQGLQPPNETNAFHTGNIQITLLAAAPHAYDCCRVNDIIRCVSQDCRTAYQPSKNVDGSKSAQQTTFRHTQSHLNASYTMESHDR